MVAPAPSREFLRTLFRHVRSFCLGILPKISFVLFFRTPRHLAESTMYTFGIRYLGYARETRLSLPAWQRLVWRRSPKVQSTDTVSASTIEMGHGKASRVPRRRRQLLLKCYLTSISIQ